MKFILMKKVVVSPVPCNGCRACCHHDRIWLHPELGDKTEDHRGNLLIDKNGRYYLKWKDDSDWCIYANDLGCSLFNDPRRPAICVELDCRRLLNLPASKRHLVGADVIRAALRLMKQAQ